MGTSKAKGCLGAGCGTLIAVGVLVVIVTLIWTGISSCRSNSEQDGALKALEPSLASYLAPEKSKAPKKVKPHLVGKVVMVNVDENDFDHLMFDLPAELRTTDPNHVGTVVQTSYEANLVGTYTSGDKGYQYTAVVKVIDRATGQLLATKRILGSEPAAQKTSHSGDEYGSKPSYEIVNWLESLPLKDGGKKEGSGASPGASASPQLPFP